MMKLDRYIIFMGLVCISDEHYCSNGYEFNNVLVYGPEVPSPAFGTIKSKAQFMEHFYKAGFTDAEIIQEGKAVAKYFLEEYGIDFTGLPDSTYLAPDVQLPNGVTFTFRIQKPKFNLNLIMASSKYKTQYFNTHTDNALYLLKFSKDFVSTGSYMGTIPAGSFVESGNILTKTCGNSILCCKTIFIRYNCDYTQLYPPQSSLPYYCRVSHDEMGRGTLTSMNVIDGRTGMMQGTAVILFPGTSQKESTGLWNPYGGSIKLDFY